MPESVLFKTVKKYNMCLFLWINPTICYQQFSQEELFWIKRSKVFFSD